MHIIIHYSELMHPFMGKSISFTAISENIYEAFANAFNNVLHELIKQRKISYGRKEHYPGADTRVRIYACHTGTGKTTLAKQHPDKFVDFVSMPYKYILSSDFDENESESCKANFDNVLDPNFPANYLGAIKKKLEECDQVLLVPPDWRLLHLLREEDIPYLICYPENTEEAKEAYRKRFVDRGNTDDFLDVFIGRWDDFMDTLENDKYGKHIIMKADAFLLDAVRTKHPAPEDRVFMDFYK